MPQQTKTEALEELARLIRRDIMNGTARLNETWWFDDDTRMQDRIAHVLLDYSDEEKLTGPTIAGATLSWMHEQIEKGERNANRQLDELNEKCAALVLEKELARGELVKLRGDNQRPIEQLAMGNPYGPGLVETPAVKRGAWVVACDNGVDPADYWTGFQWSTDIGRAEKWTEQPTWNGAGRVVFMSDLEVIE